jgi:hypothetical protein
MTVRACGTRLLNPGQSRGIWRGTSRRCLGALPAWLGANRPQWRRCASTCVQTTTQIDDSGLSVPSTFLRRAAVDGVKSFRRLPERGAMERLTGANATIVLGSSRCLTAHAVERHQRDRRGQAAFRSHATPARPTTNSSTPYIWRIAPWFRLCPESWLALWDRAKC